MQVQRIAFGAGTKHSFDNMTDRNHYYVMATCYLKESGPHLSDNDSYWDYTNLQVCKLSEVLSAIIFVVQNVARSLHNEIYAFKAMKSETKLSDFFKAGPSSNSYFIF